MFKSKKPIIRFLLILSIVIVIVFTLLFTSLAIYSSNSYESLPEMNEQINLLNTSNVTLFEDRRSIQYQVSEPQKNIVFIPGGLVEPDSYKYLAISLAKENYNVTIVKPLFNLAILNSNQAINYIDEDLDNIVIGHSLGGTVASIVASKQEEVMSIIFLGSYPLRDVSDINALIITGEFDEVLNQESFSDSLNLVGEETVFMEIAGGNHAQFGWYGPQKGDGEAMISTLEQQNQIIQAILNFIE